MGSLLPFFQISHQPADHFHQAEKGHFLRSDLCRLKAETLSGDLRFCWFDLLAFLSWDSHIMGRRDRETKDEEIHRLSRTFFLCQGDIQATLSHSRFLVTNRVQSGLREHSIPERLVPEFKVLLSETVSSHLVSLDLSFLLCLIPSH